MTPASTRHTSGSQRFVEPIRRAAIVGLLLLCAGSLGCQSNGGEGTSESAAAAVPAPNSSPRLFSGQAAYQHMRALNTEGPRVSGTAGSTRGRAYLSDALFGAGISTHEVRVPIADSQGDSIDLTHLIAAIPGESNDVLLLATHYDTSPLALEAPARNDQNASGPALLLELARALDEKSKPEYTIWLAFIDGDALGDAESALEVDHLGTQSLIDEWIREESLARIRAAVFFGNVGERDQPILRDIASPRIYREIFWQVAHELGYSRTFPAESHYGVTTTGRATAAEASLRSSVALENSTDRSGSSAFTAESAVPTSRHLRPSAGFEAVGNVALESITRTAAKLRKIDRFAATPLQAGRSEDALPVSLD